VTKATEFQYDDYMAAILQYESGLIARVTANFGCVHRHQHMLRIYGTKGTFILDDMGPRLFRNRNENTTPELLKLDTLPNNKGVLIPGFINSIVKGEPSKEVAYREFDLISVIAASNEAHRTMQSVNIEYIYD